MALDAFPFFADVLDYWPQIVRGLRDTPSTRSAG